MPKFLLAFPVMFLKISPRKKICVIAQKNQIIRERTHVWIKAANYAPVWTMGKKLCNQVIVETEVRRPEGRHPLFNYDKISQGRLKMTKNAEILFWVADAYYSVMQEMNDYWSLSITILDTFSGDIYNYYFYFFEQRPPAFSALATASANVTDPFIRGVPNRRPPLPLWRDGHSLHSWPTRNSNLDPHAWEKAALPTTPSDATIDFIEIMKERRLADCTRFSNTQGITE